jgi:hypothetical protein
MHVGKQAYGSFSEAVWMPRKLRKRKEKKIK